MSTKDKIEYWLDIAQYDLVSAKAMLESKRFLYVGFLYHQVAEKCLKAYYWHSLKKQPPYSHNLLFLSEESRLDELIREEDLLLFNELMPLNIQARYPEDRDLLMKSLTKNKSEDLYKRTKRFYTWIKKLLR